MEAISYLNRNINRESLPLLRQLIIIYENKEMYEKIITDLQNESDNEIEYYIEIAQTNNKNEFINKLLQKLENHEELKNKYSSFLTDDI